MQHGMLNLHEQFLSWQFFPIYFHSKLYKTANITIFVYYIRENSKESHAFFSRIECLLLMEDGMSDMVMMKLW